MFRYISLAAIVFLFVRFSVGQTAVKLSSKEFIEAISPVRKEMNKEFISMQFKKDVYRDINSEAPLESSSGIIYRGAGLTYKLVEGGVSVLQTNEMRIVIDSSEMLVQISDLDSSMKALSMMGDLSEELLDQYDLEQEIFPSYRVFKATPKSGNDGTITFYVHSKTDLLYKLVMSFPAANYFSEELDDETLEEPYVSVIYEPIHVLKPNEVSFSYSTYLEVNDQGECTLTPSMSAFKLHDTRYKPTKQ